MQLIERVLGYLQWEKYLCYLDDLVISGSDFKTSLQNLKEVFERLRQANLKSKPSKRKFFQKQTSFLGHVVSEKRVNSDPEKILAIQNWSEPKTKTEVKSFLGLVNHLGLIFKICRDLSSPY